MTRYRRPVNVRLHRPPPADGVAGKQQEPAKRLDLVELFLAILAANLDPVFIDQHRHKIAAIAFAVALNAADLVKE